MYLHNTFNLLLHIVDITALHKQHYRLHNGKTNSMIFNTIRQSLEDVYIAGRKINELNNLKLNATNIAAYATALKGLNAKQAELILSTQGLTVAQESIQYSKYFLPSCQP